MNIPLMFRRFRFKHFLFVVLVSVTPGKAQWTANPSVNTPVGVSLNDEQNPAMVSDGAGGAIVVWEEDRGVATSIDIIAQRIDALGNVRWGAAGVIVSSATGAQRFPTIIADGSGGAIIAWYDGRGLDTDIYAQKVDADGSVMWLTNGVPLCLAPGNQWDPVITGDGVGGAIVTWYEARYDTAADIFAQRISSTGTVQWAIDGVPLCAAQNGQVAPVVTGDGAGGAIAVWLDFRNGVVELFSQRVSQAGAVLWGADGVRVCDGSGFQYAPAIASDGGSGAIITWNDFRSGVGSDIYAQRISFLGVRQWPATGAEVCIAPDYQYAPQIVSDGSSGAVICWYDYRNGVNSDIYVQRMTPLGGSLWTPNGISICVAGNEQQFPVVASDGRGGAFVAWHDTRNGGNADIFAQHVSSGGVIGFSNNGVAVSTALNVQHFPRIISNSSGGAILVWGDGRNLTQQDIYAQRIVLDNPDAAFGFWAGGVSRNIEATTAYAGLHPNALDGADPRDISEPSTLPFNYVSVTSLSLLPVDRFIQDIKQETAQLSHTAKRYSLQSRTNAAGSPVNLVFTEDRLPAQFTPVLYRIGSGWYQDLRKMPVYSYTASSTPGEPHELLLLLGDSTKPAVSIAAPNGGEVLVSGFPYTIRWNASDSSGLLRHYLYVTLDGAPPYTLIDSTSGQSNSYVWTPSNAAINAFIRIITIDSVLNVNSDTSDASFTIVAGDSIAYTTFAGWNMIGVPTLQTDMSPRGIFSDDFGGNPINVYGFNPITGYVVPDTLRLGAGYWLRTPSALAIDAVGAPQPTVSFSLHTGWNMIGNPFPAPLPKSMLRFTDGVTTKTINEAQSAGWLIDVVYGFTSAGYVQENVSLAVWNGYWMRTLIPNISILYNLGTLRPTHPGATLIQADGQRTRSDMVRFSTH
jgi:predicted lipoprotein with Yx(FWY)xxD motif